MPERRELLGEQPVRAAVDPAARQQVVARAEQREQRARRRAHAARQHQRGLRALERARAASARPRRSACCRSAGSAARRPCRPPARSSRVCTSGVHDGRVRVVRPARRRARRAWRSAWARVRRVEARRRRKAPRQAKCPRRVCESRSGLTTRTISDGDAPAMSRSDHVAARHRVVDHAPSRAPGGAGRRPTPARRP